MTTKAVEAGARAIWEARKANDLSAWTTKNAARLCIEAAIASGELVPASAVAAERERCIQAIRNAPCPDGDGYYTMTKDDAIAIIRALEPASGEHVLGWRDISTAPKDGTFLVFEDGRVVAVDAVTAWGAPKLRRR